MLIASFHPVIGGAERQALEVSRFLIKEGAKVRVVTRRLAGTKSKENIEGVPVRRIFCPASGFFNSVWFMAASFLWLLRHCRSYNVIHVHLAASHSLSACLAGKILRKGVFITVGGGAGIGELAASSRSFTGRIKLRLLAAFAPKLLIVTPELTPELERYGLGKLDAVLLPNGVDVEKFSPPSPEEKLDLRKKLGIGSGVAFLFAGRLAMEKLIPDFVETWDKAARLTPDYKTELVIAGDGPQEALIRQAALKAELPPDKAPSGIKPFIISAQGGNLTSNNPAAIGRAKNIADYYRACDVFVLPSISEGLSCAMLEAMACGMAVMATANGGARDAVTEGETGFLFDPTDKPAIEGTIRLFMERPGLAAEMGAKARKTAESGFNMKDIAQASLEIYAAGDGN